MVKENREIKEISFMIGTQGDGFTDNVIKFSRNKVERKSENFMYHKNYDDILKLDKKTFLEEFEKLNVEEWKDSYVVFRHINGYSWELNVFYKNGEKLIKKGSNDYPENMDEFLSLLEIEFERDSLELDKLVDYNIDWE